MTSLVGAPRSPRLRERRRQDGSVGRGLLLALLAWILMPFAITEIGVRLWKPGFPGFRLPQVMHRPAEPYGFELVPSQHVFSIASPVTINDQGFRGLELRSRSEVGFRVLCAGDSFTFGYGVSDGETFPRQLEDLLREGWPELEPEVVNAGVQGYATYQEIDFLRVRGLSLEPDAVVLAVYRNDLEVRPEGDYAEHFRHEFAEAKSTFRHRAERVHWALQNSAALTLVNQLYRARQHAAAPQDGKESGVGDDVWRSMEEDLRSFGRLSKEHGFYPLVLVIPERFQLTVGDPEAGYPDGVLAAAERLGLEAIDLRPVLLEAIEAGIDPYLAWDHHLGPEGNRRVAAVVRDRLARAGMLRSSPRRLAPGASPPAVEAAGAGSA